VPHEEIATSLPLLAMAYFPYPLCAAERVGHQVPRGDSTCALTHPDIAKPVDHLFAARKDGGDLSFPIGGDLEGGSNNSHPSVVLPL